MRAPSRVVTGVGILVDVLDEWLVFEADAGNGDSKPVQRAEAGRKPDWVDFADSLSEFEDTVAFRSSGNLSIPPTFVDRVDVWVEFDDRDTDDLLERKRVVLRKAALPDGRPSAHGTNGAHYETHATSPEGVFEFTVIDHD